MFHSYAAKDSTSFLIGGLRLVTGQHRAGHLRGHFLKSFRVEIGEIDLAEALENCSFLFDFVRLKDVKAA